MSQSQTDPRVIIIGAGMSGLLMAIKLIEAGNHNFCIYEKAHKVGGTWRENTYPNIACDVFAPAYNYSFDPNTEWNWRFGRGEEIQRYFEKIEKKYGLTDYIQFNTTVDDARWQDNQWHITTANGTEQADVLVSAVGALHHPRYPDIEGIDSFDGPCFHTARWDHTIDLYDKNVGIIGTGSTAAQVVPGIVDKVARLNLFQRSPHWVMPTPDVKYHEFGKSMKRRFGWLAKLQFKIDLILFALFSHAITGNRFLLWCFDKAVRSNLMNIKDPELRAKMTPHYPAGCKRLVISEDFYPAVQKTNVELVTEGIERIVPEGVITKDGKTHALDTLVLATGFYPYKTSVNITGLNGKTLEQAWEGSPDMYRTVCVPDFPNYFVLFGPYSPIANFSIIANSEVQVAYTIKCIEKIAQGKFKAMHPKASIAASLKDEMREAFKGTVWAGGCDSWYLDDTGTPLSYPFSMARYREELEAPVLHEFELI